MMNNTSLQLENYHDKLKQETMEIILDEIYLYFCAYTV